MRIFIHLLKWDFRFAARYNIITIAVIVTALYCSIFFSIDFTSLEPLIVFFIFSDPSLLGFMFIGALVLFEKSANTLKALVVTPIKTRDYLLSKTISLTIISVLGTIPMAIAAKGCNFNFFYLISAVSLTSIFFIFLGFVGVARVKNINQYLIIMGNFLIPFILPFLNYLNITDFWLFYLLPTQASLLLLDASFNGISWQAFSYSIICLIVWISIAYYMAQNAFRKHIIPG